MGTETMLTIQETAARLRISHWTLRRWITARRVSTFKLGHVIRIPESDLTRLIESGTRPAAGAVLPLSAARRRLAGGGR